MMPLAGKLVAVCWKQNNDKKMNVAITITNELDELVNGTNQDNAMV